MAPKVTPRIANRLSSRQKVVAMERDSGGKRVGRYIVIALVIIAIVEVCSLPILYFMAGMPDYSILHPHTEIIRIKSTSVTKSTNAYFVTLNIANTGDRKTEVDSVLLNGVSYDDPGWTGTIKPLIFGDMTPKTVIETGASYSGIIIFSDDCKDPSGNKLMAGGDDYYYLKITIHTIGGKDYETTVMLTQGPIPETSPPPALMLATATVAIITLVALFIMVRRRTRTNTIKGLVMSV